MNENGYDAYSRYKNANIESIRALQNNLLNIRIIIPTGIGAKRELITIPCFLANDITIGGMGNEWGSLLNTEIIAPIVNSLQDSLNLINTFIGSEGGGGSAQVTLMSRHMTAASWRGSKLPIFSIPLVFVSLDPQINPIDTFLALARAVLPNSLDETGGQNQTKLTNFVTGAAKKVGSAVLKTGYKAVDWLTGDNKDEKAKQELDERIANADNYVSQMITGGMLEAPLGYGLSIRDSKNFMTPNENSTINLQIGTWLNAYGLIADSLGTPTFSRQTMKGTGVPLYIKCNLTLRPYKMITYSEFLNYFQLKKRTEAY